MDKGWIKLNRQITENWIWQNHEYAYAWIDMLLIAEHKTHKSIWRGNITEFKRGDVCLSIKKLAERWGWSRKKVRHFLEQLEGDGMVHLNAHQMRTTITIVNYGFFQDKGTSDGTPKRTPKGTSDGTPKGTSEGTYLKNDKNDKEVQEDEPAALDDDPYDSDDPYAEELKELDMILNNYPLDSPERKAAYRRLNEIEMERDG